MIEGTVDNVKPYGVFVRINGPEQGLDGMIPVSETDTPEGSDLGVQFPVGKNVKAKVVRVDERGRIRLSVRALTGGAQVVAASQEPPPAGKRYGIMADAFKRARDT